jgi:hypothetical protein
MPEKRYRARWRARPPEGSRAARSLQLRLALVLPHQDHAVFGSRPPTARELLNGSRSHAFRNASRSALIVAACVVGMPCGKPS